MLPPRVSSAHFRAALTAFEKIVGREWLFTSDDDVAMYRDAYSPFWGEPEERRASAAVAPSSVEQVQEIVRVAGRYGIPLYPISTGKNFGYGGPAPVYSGSVVLDLKRMNRIVEINEQMGYVVVEPGVSFFDLYRVLRERKLNFLISVPAPGWGGLIGNSLDHGFGTVVRDHFANHVGMEVVLGTGELLRTGMGAISGSPMWNVHNGGYGPYIDGLFLQSNFGVVTKMGFNLVPEPEVIRSLTVSVWRHEQLDSLIATNLKLEQGAVSRYGAGVVSPLMGSPEPDIVALHNRAGGAAAAEWNALAKQKNKPVFATNLRFQGPEKVVNAEMEHVRDSFAHLEGVTFTDGPAFRFPLDLETVDDLGKDTLGIPALWTFIGLPMQGNNGHFFFSPNLPMNADAVRDSNRVFHEICRPFGVHWGWAGMANVFPKTLTIIKDFNSGRSVHDNKRNRELVQRLIEGAAEHGWSEYRTPAAFQDIVMKGYSFNNHALLRFHETVKDALDPHGILAAGKSGIWPKHLREQRK